MKLDRNYIVGYQLFSRQKQMQIGETLVDVSPLQTCKHTSVLENFETSEIS